MTKKCAVKTSLWFKTLFMGCQTLGTNITFHALESDIDLYYSSYLINHAAVCTIIL